MLARISGSHVAKTATPHPGGFQIGTDRALANSGTIRETMPFQRKSARKDREPLDEPALYEYAVRTLGRKMRTVAELSRLLRTRVEPGEAGEAKVQAILARLKEQNYLDDARYAADYTRMRQENQRFGQRRVQQELNRRGVQSETVNETVTAAYAELPEPELVRKYIERKRLRQPTNDKESARIVRNLIRAGFSMRAIYAVLKAWNVPEETLAAIPESEPEEER
jgi:regulatory protein